MKSYIAVVLCVAAIAVSSATSAISALPTSERDTKLVVGLIENDIDGSKTKGGGLFKYDSAQYSGLDQKSKKQIAATQTVAWLSGSGDPPTFDKGPRDDINLFMMYRLAKQIPAGSPCERNLTGKPCRAKLDMAFPTLMRGFKADYKENSVALRLKNWDDLYGDFRSTYPVIEQSHMGILALDAIESADVRAKASSLYKAYDENEIAADEKYKGKSVAVSGQISQIGKDFLEEPYLELATDSPFQTVHLRFSRDDARALAHLKKSQDIVALCKGAGLMLGRPILDCRRN